MAAAVKPEAVLLIKQADSLTTDHFSWLHPREPEYQVMFLSTSKVQLSFAAVIVSVLKHYVILAWSLHGLTYMCRFILSSYGRKSNIYSVSFFDIADVLRPQ